jgi:predicted secreted hydrolase
MALKLVMTPHQKRRRLAWLGGHSLLALGSGLTPSLSTARSPPGLSFPRDHGAHFEQGIEWWYVTGSLSPQAANQTRQTPAKATPAEPIGFQVTFFRRATGQGLSNPSRFSPRQLVFSQVALASRKHGKLIHDEAAYRLGFENVAALDERDTRLRVLHSTMVRQGDRYHIDIVTERIQMSLQLQARFGPVLQGENGKSQKGAGKVTKNPDGPPFSFYYSRPQLEVSGSITRTSPPSVSDPSKEPLGLLGNYGGTAWLDHEWSDHLLDETAAGWDWTGLNFDDGESLMAFQIRPKRAQASSLSRADLSYSARMPLWSEARGFDRNGKTHWSIAPGVSANQRAQQVQFKVLRYWRSLRSNALYPVEMEIVLHAQGSSTKKMILRPLMDDQEIDARRSTGGFYWEGLVLVFDGERRIGQGYLELTGYAEAIRL